MIPAFINELAGTAANARSALEKIGGFEIHEAPPKQLEDAIRAELAKKPERITVAGGDGTVGTAAALTTKSETELAVIPGGTLNHFARYHGIPTELEAAAETAARGQRELVDVAYVNDRLFLNTSSVGAYVTYVRRREKLEKYLGYKLASLVAAVQLFFTLRPITVDIEVDGKRRHYSTPIVFISVGERETRSPHFGNRVAGGKSCLHVLVVRERRAARLLAVALEAAERGLQRVAETPELDSFMVDSCEVGVKGRHRHVAVDGEIIELGPSLRYRLAAKALKIIVPANGAPT